MGTMGFVRAAALSISLGATGAAVAQSGQPYIGPFVPNMGMQITTAFTNDFGRDADATTIIDQVTPEAVMLEQRLKAVGFGETRPKADNETFAGRAINRRVEFRRLDR